MELAGEVQVMAMWGGGSDGDRGWGDRGRESPWGGRRQRVVESPDLVSGRGFIKTENVKGR